MPTAHADAPQSLSGLADFVACLNIRTRTPYAVADAYERWSDVLELQAQDQLKAQGAPALVRLMHAVRAIDRAARSHRLRRRHEQHPRVPR